MGAIRNTATGRLQLLEPEHLVGRGSSCMLRLSDGYISAQHALLRWNGERWELKDLGSRNGTFLNGIRIKAGEEHPAPKGSKIAFGKVEQAWELVDAGGPCIMVVPLEGGSPVLLEGTLLALPSSEDPVATAYRHDDSWVLERPDEPLTPIHNGQVFEVAGRRWRFCCADDLRTTSQATPLMRIEVAQLELSFSVSRDEEHVELRARCGGTSLDLGARTHNYLLLTLARRRLADAAEGTADTSCGWIYQEDLAHDPAMVPPQLNIDVFRIRRHFAAAGVLDAANIIERRPRTHQLRIGTGRLSIVTL
jgi:hypothetical protein